MLLGAQNKMDSVTRIVLQKAKVEADNDQTADEVNPDVT